MHPKVSFLVTASEATGFFHGQLAFFAANGWDVEMVSSPGPGLEKVHEQGATPRAVRMEREIHPGRDLVSLWRLWRLFRRTCPDLVVAGTPKAGLLGTLAARAAGVPHVVYTAQGLRLETATGCKRGVLRLTEWLSCHAADRVLSVSPSLRARLIELGLVSATHCRVPGNGTSNGVDVKVWRRTLQTAAAGQHARAALGIAASAPVIGFVGRLVRDKGIAELYAAFIQLRRSIPDLRLLLVGDFESGDPVAPQLRAQLREDAAVSITGFVADPAPYYWAMDVLGFPTYREGFPGVPLEAQAAGVPVVTTNATGAMDAIVDGITGIRVAVGDVDALHNALGLLLSDAELRAHMGEAGSRWVEDHFERETVWHNLLAEYRTLLKSPRRRPLQRWLKASFDRSVAAFGLLLLAPLLLAVAVAVRWSMGSPVLFCQLRPGLNGRPFTLFKFRTMRETCDEHGQQLSHAGRQTRVGRLIHSLGLDELPQLWNVLRGEMSLVGPRPLLMQYLHRYTPDQARRHDVEPGITGWAQVHGRKALSWEEKFALDVWYVDHWSLGLDIKILWRTVRKLAWGDGVSLAAHAAMPEFAGSSYGAPQPK